MQRNSQFVRAYMQYRALGYSPRSSRSLSVARGVTGLRPWAKLLARMATTQARATRLQQCYEWPARTAWHVAHSYIRGGM